MRHLSYFLAGLGLLFVLMLDGACYAAEQSACQSAHEAWTNSIRQLKEYVEECRAAKLASFAGNLEEKLAKNDGRLPVATVVRDMLEQRRQTLAEAAHRCQDLAALEAQSFTEYRACRGQFRPRSGRASSEPAERSVEREQILAGLQDLLLDEAYEQYRHTRPVVLQDSRKSRAAETAAPGRVVQRRPDQ